IDQPVNAVAGRRQRQERRLMQQAVQIEIGALADQLQLKRIGLADRLKAAEGQHLEVVLDAGKAQAELGVVGGRDHVGYLVVVHENPSAWGGGGKAEGRVSRLTSVRCAPVIRTRGAGDLVGPDDLAVGEVDVFQV